MHGSAVTDQHCAGTAYPVLLDVLCASARELPGRASGPARCAPFPHPVARPRAGTVSLSVAIPTARGSLYDHENGGLQNLVPFNNKPSASSLLYDCATCFSV